MKIAIIGFSGSGKSTLAKTLSNQYNIPVMHMDSINFLPGWNERNNEESKKIVKQFIDKNDSWIIDGNYAKIMPERFELADLVIFLNFNRFVCLKGVIKRYKENKGKTRSDMCEGCDEKLDLSFLWWVFFKGRSRKRKHRLMNYALNAKTNLIFRNRKQLKKYIFDISASFQTNL